MKCASIVAVCGLTPHCRSVTTNSHLWPLNGGRACYCNLISAPGTTARAPHKHANRLKLFMSCHSVRARVVQDSFHKWPDRIAACVLISLSVCTLESHFRLHKHANTSEQGV